MSSEEFVWNFAHGSNMNSKVLKGRRNLNPKESIPGYVKDYKLAFSLTAAPYFEPGMGSLDPAKGEEAHGLLMKFTKSEMDILYSTEGGKKGGYCLVEVEATAYDGRKLKAFAFQSKYIDETSEVQPSKRYLNIIKEGAKEIGLKQEYLDKLDKIEPYQDSIWKKIIFGVFHLPLFLLIFTIFGISGLLRKLNLAVDISVVTGSIVRWGMKLTWLSHDYIFRFILGHGGKYPKKNKY